MYGSRGHRSSTTPMDFEYTNRVGPVDPASPFMNINNQSAKKRPHSVLDSPSKKGFATQNLAQLRDPDNRPFYFSQDASKPLPSIPAHVQNAWEPRTPASTYDFSSGGETPNTPQLDSDPATPDTQLADKMGRLGNGDGDATSHKKPTVARRESWFRRAFLSSPSPSKEPKDRDRYYSHKAEHRIQKRRSERSDRSRSRKKATVRDVEDEDSDTQLINSNPFASNPPQSQVQPKTTYAMSIAGFLHWIEAHPHLPSVLSFYMQLVVNVSLGFGFLYIVYCAWCGIMSDVDIASLNHLNEVMVEIANCAHNYNTNRCHPDEKVPALTDVCAYWETCMKRDPKKVARASVTAKTFAKIFNGFVDEFSYKSMIFTAFIIFGGFNLSNWAFGLLRSKQHPPTPNPNDYIPQTPHRVPSNNYLEHSQQNFAQDWQQNTPYQTPYGNRRHIEAPPLAHTQSMPALPLPSVAQEGANVVEDRRSPKKRGFW